MIMQTPRSNMLKWTNLSCETKFPTIFHIRLGHVSHESLGHFAWLQTLFLWVHHLCLVGRSTLILSLNLSPWPKNHKNFIPTPHSIYIHCCTNLELVKFGGLVWLRNGGSVFELLMFVTFLVVGWMWLASIPSNGVLMFSVVVLPIQRKP